MFSNYIIIESSINFNDDGDNRDANIIKIIVVK